MVVEYGRMMLSEYLQDLLSLTDTLPHDNRGLRTRKRFVVTDARLYFDAYRSLGLAVDVITHCYLPMQRQTR